MEHWDLRTLDVEPHQPKILHSARGEARSILINLPAGEELQEHQVHERAYVVVIDGEVDLGGHAGGPGAAAVFDPRRAARGQGDQRRAAVDRARPVARGWPPGRTGLSNVAQELCCSEARERGSAGGAGVPGVCRRFLTPLMPWTLRGLVAEAVDPGLVGDLAAQVGDARLDVDRDAALGRVGGAEDLRAHAIGQRRSSIVLVAVRRDGAAPTGALHLCRMRRRRW